MLYFLVFLILFVIIAPALVIIPQSFTSLNYFVYPIKEFSLKWYVKFFENSEWITSLERSIVIALLVAVLATIIGTLAALAVNKLNFKGKNLFLNLMLTPMIVPVVITGVALYASFAKVGLNNSILGLVMAHSLLAIPMVFLTMSSALARFDTNLELAAMSMGSTPIGAFFKVTVPGVKSSLVTSALLSFVTSLDEVVVTIFVSGADTKTLPMVMWENLRATIDPTIAVAATFLIILTLGMYVIKEIFEAKSKD
ncbi:MAG: ABC transporter permease [Succinivibrio sp.]|nr:ABC transporter permease [Succinivibrio sp.]